ncbi:uncharacterized protein G2W53_004575 [Senna tora]|uniref:Uncharacterized protein n=1 Tax=Senna tora TaxID=362788 RepID=A0A834XCI4_9FABA|nr:uncharacterized protein G2W53_004575 [Senna tora]
MGEVGSYKCMEEEVMGMVGVETYRHREVVVKGMVGVETCRHMEEVVMEIVEEGSCGLKEEETREMVVDICVHEEVSCDGKVDCVDHALVGVVCNKSRDCKVPERELNMLRVFGFSRVFQAGSAEFLVNRGTQDMVNVERSESTNGKGISTYAGRLNAHIGHRMWWLGVKLNVLQGESAGDRIDRAVP